MSDRGVHVYQRFAQTVNGVVPAQGGSPTRRPFVEAEHADPLLGAQALDFSGTLYAQEAPLRQRNLKDEVKLGYRATHLKPIVGGFLTWLAHPLSQSVLLPANPFTKAARYALEREPAVRVVLEYPHVPLDTNPLEREIRALALGRKNWLFCWTEVGARYVGLVQSLSASCRLQGVDPYVDCVAVRQRIDTHPALEVSLLTPRLWKQHFADNPLRSDLDRLRQ